MSFPVLQSPDVTSIHLIFTWFRWSLHYKVNNFSCLINEGLGRIYWEMCINHPISSGNSLLTFSLLISCLAKWCLSLCLLQILAFASGGFNQSGLGLVNFFVFHSLGGDILCFVTTLYFQKVYKNHINECSTVLNF